MYPPGRQYQNILLYLTVFLDVINTTTSQQSGILFVLSASGHHLTEHVFTQYKTASITECAQYCVREISTCKSINYKSRHMNQDSSKNCQLNNVTKLTQPQNLVVNIDYNYYEPLIKEKPTNEKSCSVKHAKSCDALHKSGKTTTGVYTIDPDGQGDFQVRCDMTSTPGRGWTIFQRRVDGSVDFYRNWNDYKNGFGKLTGEFWLGLDKIHRLSASGQSVLRVDLGSFENETRYANFGTFTVGNENEGYILSIGQYTGDAGDSMNYHSGMKFTTKDVDNDYNPNAQCSQTFKGACGTTNVIVQT